MGAVRLPKILVLTIDDLLSAQSAGAVALGDVNLKALGAVTTQWDKDFIVEDCEIENLPVEYSGPSSTRPKRVSVCVPRTLKPIGQAGSLYHRGMSSCLLFTCGPASDPPAHTHQLQRKRSWRQWQWVYRA